MASKEVWRDRAKAWKESGKSSEIFSREIGVDAGELRSWTSKLGMSSPRKLTQDKRMQATPQLVPVVRRPSFRIAPPNTHTKSGITITMGQTKIDVEVGFDVGTLQAVVAMIEESRH
jgi:hypothetical protein